MAYFYRYTNMRARPRTKNEISPCYGCLDRNVGEGHASCHSTCKRYADNLAARQEKKQKIKEANAAAYRPCNTKNWQRNVHNFAEV